jgi:hypothetical protein
MAVVGQTGNTAIQVTESGTASYVVLIALTILFGAAAYFTGRLAAGFVVTVFVLYTLGGIGVG